MASNSQLRSEIKVFILYSVLYFTSAAAALHGIDKSVCDPSTILNSLTPKKPVLSEDYRLTVECNIQNKNYTTDFTEYFDFTNQRAAVHQWELGFHAYGIYNYAANELYTVEVQTGQCKVDHLSSSDSTFLFGFKTSSTNPKVGRMFTAYGALRFGNGTNEQYMGRTKIRGMQVDEWKSCQYWSDKDATMEVHWYFSAPTWGMADGRSQVPVRCYVKGLVYEDKGGPQRVARNFEHTYEFSDYLTDAMAQLTTSRFETPSGVICPGRSDTKSLPTPNSAFSFTAEILQPDAQSIGFIKEWYDQKMKLCRYDYVPSSSSVSGFGYGLLSQVHDFNEGIAYIIDPTIGNCTAQPLDGTGFDAKFVDATMTNVRIRTPAEFFYFDKSQYAYEGVKNVRGVDCDVYITQRTDWPPLNTDGTTSKWEWYFARNQWVQSTGSAYTFGMPLMLIITADEIGSYIYNIYQYDEEPPKIWDFDTTRCYNYTQKKDFLFKLPGDYKSTAGQNLQQFKYMTLTAVHNVTGLSPVRITNLQVDYDATDIIVSLTILGTATIKGDVTSPLQQIALKDAVTSLTNAINNGKLVVPVNVNPTSPPQMLTARPYSLKTTTIKTGYYKPGPNKTTYTTGAVIGLAIGMAVFFFIIGFGAVYMFYKRNGGSFEKSDKPMDNPAYENAS